MRVLLVVASLFVAAPAWAQESRFASDVRREREDLAKACGDFTLTAVAGCIYNVATAEPFHITFGTLAPQNGVAVGLAFVEHYTAGESWRLSWNGDAVISARGGWRAGGYMKLVRTPASSGVVVRPPGTAAPAATIAPRELMVVDLHAQAISLPSVNFFGIGGATSDLDRATFGERETIVGGSIVYPLGDRAFLRALRPALIGGVDGRFIAIRDGNASDVASITARYNDVTAPGLAAQRPFVELREGVRLAPSLGNGAVQLNYRFTAQQFRTSDVTSASFDRWTVDLRHEIPLYRRVASAASSDAVGPDQCAHAVNGRCPTPAWSRNREGAIAFRAVAMTSTTDGLNRVPFYLQPTVGGSDINGQPLLAAYDDYRFRAPSFVVLQETIEHSITGPIGAYVLLEQGAIGDRIGLNPLLQSYTVGVTLRAGGFPLVNLSFAWNRDSHHTIATISPTLIGGSSRPSIF